MISITPEQLDTIYDLKSGFNNVTSIDLENKTPNGLEVKLQMYRGRPYSSQSVVYIYSLNSDGAHVFVDSYFNK